MARRRPSKVGLALALICVITSGQAEETCRTGCRGAPQTFKYHEGTTYKYNFDSKIEVSLSSAEGQKSITEVKATVLLTQQPQCNQIIRLQNVQVIGNDGKKHSNLPDVDKPISINYHDGHLEDSICITPGDNQNSLNLKRAIASILQANLQSGHETDVFGLCPTEVTHHKEGNILVVQKARNLNRCAYREFIKQDFIATAFNLNSEIKSSPILNGDYDAKLKIKNGILDQATVHEHYLYVPFSVGTNGAKTSIETNLKYVGTAKDNSQVKGGHPRSIIFEDPHPVNSPQTNVNSILHAVKQTAKTIGLTVGENTAKEFTNLVRILRVSKKDDLLAVYNQVRAGVGFSDKIAGKKIFLDALLRAGNGDNIEVAIELLKNKELTPIEQNLVFLGLSTVRHPTEGSLITAGALLDQPNLPRSAYLGIGNLAGRFCRQHPCQHVDAVHKLTQKLAQKLAKQPKNRQEENDVVYVLKALGNFHHLDDHVLDKVVELAQSKEATRVRVTALETYLADACKDKLRESALGILKDVQQDSEVRIKAYLVLAQCPNSHIASAIKAVLEKEPSYQVGGFIQTHIRNIRASANPDKELAKQHLGQITTSKKFPFDLRKYSANGEFSYTIDTLGIANSIESNIIYSQKSFLPRSTSLNLTAEVFGHTLNFLDIQTRQENLDRLIEHYLGPKGLLRSKTLQELWDGTGPRIKKITDEVKERLQKIIRSRRDLSKSEIDAIGKQVEIKTNQLNTDLDLDLSVKAFGSEILFLNINDDFRKYTPEAIIDQIVHGFNQGLDKIKHFEETLRSNLLFLDAELSYPTSAGFPLRLGVEGSANLQVKTSGSFDPHSSKKIKFALIPSANIEVAGRLTVDTLVVESGLKVISTLHTATGGDLNVELLGNGEDVKFSFPIDKQNILSASHDVVFHTREWGAPEVNTPLKFAQNKDFSICLDQLSPFIGLTFCGEFTGPNLQGQKVPILPFPFSGDAKLAVTIEKEDLSLYHFRDQYYTGDGKLGTELVLESLGKGGQKKVSLTFEAFALPEKYIKATLTSPITSASLEGRITMTDSERSIFVRFNQDKNEYFGKIGVAVQGSAAKSIYKPIVQYKTPQDAALQVPPYRVDGQVIVENNGPATTYTLDNVKLIIPNSKTITVNGKFGHEPETLFSDLTVSDGNSNASFKGKLRVNANLVKYNAELKNSLNPAANVHLKGELAKSPEEIKNFFQIAHGGDFSDKNNIFTLENSLKHRNKGPQDYLLDTKNKLSYPGLGANFELEFQLKPNAAKYEADFQYGATKFGSELEYEQTPKKEGNDFKLEFGLYGFNNRVNIKGKRTITGDVSQIDNSYEINGKRTEIKGKIKHHVRPQDIDVGADLEVKVPQHNSPFKVLADFKLNSNEIDASHKITSGGTNYFDAFLKANKAGNANGSLKVNLKGQLVVTGQLKANKGSGNGDLLVELPGQGRSSKIDSTFTVHEPNFNIVVNIYPIFNKDKSKKITLSTQTILKPHNLDSKNFIDFFGSKLEANVKGSQTGDIHNGKINGEAEVTLPNNCYFAGKVDREMKTVNHVLNGHAIGSLEYRPNKNQPGNKLSVKGNVKNTNPNEKIFDLNYQISAESATGKNLNFDLGIKRVPQGDKFLTQVNNKIYGSELPSPIENVFKGTCTQLTASYEGFSSYAPLGKISIKGKHDITGSGKPISGEFELDIDGKGEYLRTLKFRVGGSVHKTDALHAKGNMKFYGKLGEDTVFADLDTNGEVKVSDKEARAKTTIKSGELDPITVHGGVSRIEAKEMKGDLGVEYGKGKKLSGDFSLIRLQPHEYKLDVKFETPTEKFKSNHLQVHSKHNEANTHFQSEVILTSDGKTWTSNTEIVLSEIAPSVDIKIKCPEGKLRQFTAKITKMSDRQLGGQLKIVNQKDNFLLEGTVDANIENVDDFHVKVTANAPTLKIDKYVIEAQNKPAKTGRRIQVTAKSGNKNILAGSTSYTAREEHGKVIIEGSGSFKLHEETKSANFKYIRQNLVQLKNGETGLEISFDASLGNKAIDAEFKATDKQFRILSSYCEEKKQCAHVEVDVKTTSNDVKVFNQEVEIAIDLRKLGLSHEFGLKAVTTRKEYVFDHTVDMHFQSQENSKYQYSLYIHPHEAGVSLTTPKRIIALESKVHAPATILKDGGKVAGEVFFYTDKKNQPNQKSGLVAYINLNTKGQALDGEVKFTNPALKRPFLISIKSKYVPQHFESVVVFDIFAQPDQKVVAKYEAEWSDPQNYKLIKERETLEIVSTGLHLNVHYEEYLMWSVEEHRYKGGFNLKYSGPGSKHESYAGYEVSPTDLETVVKVFNHELFRFTSRYQLKDKLQVFDSELFSYGYKPLTSHLEIKNLNTLKLTVACKDNPNDKLLINSGFKPGEIADFRAEMIKGGAKHELGHATIKLDDANFLKSDYNIQAKNLEEYLFKPVKTTLQREGDELSKLSSQLSSQGQKEFHSFSELAKKATPDISPLAHYYTSEITKIKEEILADKTIRDLSEFLHNILSVLTQAFGDSFNHFSELIENVYKSFESTFSHILEILDNDIIPKLKVTGEKFAKLFLQFVDIATHAVLTVFVQIADLAEKFQPEFQQLANVLGQVSQDIFRASLNLYDAIKSVVIDQCHQIYNEIKSIPAVEQLKAEYEQFIKHGLPARENIANAIKDILTTLKDIAPTEELKALVQAICDYVTLKLNKQPVDDNKAIDRIIQAAVASGKSVFEMISGSQPVPDFQNVQLPLPATLLNRIPKLAAFRFSPLSFVLGEELYVTDFLLSLVNRPRNWIPPFPLYGLVAQGQHIFTFDGKHLTFPGKCNYLLARDAVDGNFSVIGSYKDGFLEAISLNQGPDTITLKKHRQVLFNNGPTELPIRKHNIAAYTDEEKIVLRSVYGVTVVCGPELVVCSVTASGFYHGKLKGLLGNGNNEPYDDFTLPDGKIVHSENEFGNSYKTSPGCPAIQTVSHEGHHPNPTCDKLFSWESSLRYCFPFVPVENFKMACEHGMSAGVKETELAISVAYVAACNQHGIPIRLPQQFVKCYNGDKPTLVGDEFTVKTPGKEADIVVLVDTNKENEATYKEYIQPLIQQLTTELNGKGVSDVEFHIIAFGGENQWPSHITTAGGKLTFKSKAPNLKFGEGPKEDSLKTDCPHLDGLVRFIKTLCHDLKLAFGLDLQALTYNEGLEYPFRANAIKSIIAVTSKPCQVGHLYPLQLLRTLLYRGRTINLNLITPIDRAGAKSEAKNIVGFNSRNVFALGATKNKLKHFGDLSKELTYDDYCVDFTVQNDGNVFVSDHIHLQPKASRKQFVQMTSHGIVEQLVGIEKSYDCECKYVSPFSARNVCKVTWSKEKPQAKKAGTKS